MNFFCDLGEVLVLTEDDGDIQFSSVCHAHDIQSQAHVYAFLHRDEVRAPVSERTRSDKYPGASHGKEAMLPVIMSPGIAFCVWDSRVKAYAVVDPAFVGAYCVT